MIRCEMHSVRCFPILFPLSIKIIRNCIYGKSACCYFVHDMMKFPTIGHIKSIFMQFIAFCLCKHENLLDLIQSLPSFIPKINRNPTCYVTSKTINIHISNPIFHRIDHGCAHLFVVIIQIRDVVPICIVWWLKIAYGI